MEGIKEIVLSVWAYDGVRIITVGVLLNVVLAVAVALRTGTFSLRVLGEFLFTQLLPYVITYYSFRLLADGTDMQWVSSVVWGLITAMLAASIVDKLSQLGVPIPESVARIVRRPPAYIHIRKADE